MEPAGSMPHSQGLFNNSYPETNQLSSRVDTYFLKIHSNIALGLPNGIFPVGLLVKILKALPPSSVLVKFPAHLNLLVLITLTILGERYKLSSSSF